MSLPFTIGERTLVQQGSKKGVLSTVHLEAVRDYLKKLKVVQDPEDFDRTLDQLQVEFIRGHMEARWKGDESGVRYLFSDTGASQTQSKVLPGYFFTGLKQLAQMDMSGARLATQVWDKFAAQQTTVANKVRTIRMKVGSEVYRVIRSCVSQEYADYSNLEFVQDILDNAGEYSNLPVVDWRVSDSGMRIRFAAMDSAFFGFANLDQSVLLEEPLPMVEAWNSEVGRRRVGLRAGMWRLASTSGLGHWNAVTEYNWTHRGRTSRIQTGVQTAYSNLFSSANEVILAYQEARSITIDNAEVWMEQELKLMPDVPKRVIVASISALTDPTTTKGGVLASVVDAITLAAQSETDIFSQHDIERAASRLLMKGRAIAARNDGNIPVEA